MEWSQKAARDGITAGFFPKAILILAMFFCVGMAVNAYSNEVPLCVRLVVVKSKICV
jgi:hypothetical protein